MSDSCTEYSGN